jgi:uncharacterized protein (DUF2132 family)
MKFRLFLRLLIIVFAICFSQKAKANKDDTQNPLFQENKINTIEFWFEDDSLWDKMASEYRLKTKNYFKVKCVLNGEKFGTTGIRFKGKHSYSFAWTDKKPLKVKLNEFEDQSYHGITKFNLANAFEDPSFQRDVQSLRVLKQMGVPAPLASYARVYLNGNYFGLYILIEQLDDEFLERCFNENSGPLFESEGFCPGDGIFSSLELKENKKNYHRNELIDFIQFLKDTSDVQFFSELESRINVESFLKACAVDVYLKNLDSYAWGRCHNFYLYFDTSGKAHWIAWDYNLSFGYESIYERFYPIGLDRNIVLRRILTQEKYLKQYWAAIEEVSKLTSNRQFRKNVKRTSKMIESSVDADPNKFYGIDTFKISLKVTIFGGLSTRTPGLLEFTKAQRKLWTEYKREEGITLD